MISFMGLLVSSSLACGGLFCQSSLLPVDQTAERVIFALDKQAQQVDVHVQIFYAGPASEFAWVVPVPAVPDVASSSDILFANLDYLTRPTFFVDTRYDGTCSDRYPDYDYTDTVDTNDTVVLDTAVQRAPSVTVIATAQVGPYDQVTLQATDADALVSWLNDNGYLVPEAIAEKAAPYVAAGSYFVALKLQSDRSEGDIRPIRLRYAGTAASIPLVLTSVASAPDLRITPYVFSTSGRAVPTNYLHVQINEAAVDWLGYGGNYESVVTAAANEAGGQAFATEFAGTTAPMVGWFMPPGRYNTANLRTLHDPAAFVSAAILVSGFPGDGTMMALLRQFIPMPPWLTATGLPETAFYNCLSCYADAIAGQPFDPDALADALEDAFVRPLTEAEDLVRRFPRLTRLGSSMSADEMTRDPQFDVAEGLADVSNVHRAELVYDCTVTGSFHTAPRTLALSDGTQIAVPSWDAYEGPSYLDQLDTPAAAVIEQLSVAQDPVVVVDNEVEIAADVVEYNESVLGTEGYAPEVVDGAVDEAAACGGCESVGSGAAGWTALGLVGMLAIRRREDRRSAV